MTDDAAYHDRCDILFAELEAELDAAAVDFDSNGHVIEAELDGGGELVINRQAAACEVWIAAPSGGRHFRWQNGEWRDTRDERELKAVLRELIA